MTLFFCKLVNDLAQKRPGCLLKVLCIFNIGSISRGMTLYHKNYLQQDLAISVGFSSPFLFWNEKIL